MLNSRIFLMKKFCFGGGSGGAYPVDFQPQAVDWQFRWLSGTCRG